MFKTKVLTALAVCGIIAAALTEAQTYTGTATYPPQTVPLVQSSSSSGGSVTIPGYTVPLSITVSQSSGSSSGSSSSSSSGGAFGLKVSGARTVSTQTGTPVDIVGMNMSGCETTSLPRCALIAGYGAANWKTAFVAAHAGNNTVRLPVSATIWNNTVCNGVTPDPSNVYHGYIQKIVSDANAGGLYVIIDEHWTAPNGTPVTCTIGQNSDADADNSIPFWKSIAATFGNNPAVLFELINEPFGSGVYGSSVIQNGSTYTPGPDALKTANGGTYAQLWQVNNANNSAIVTTTKTWTVAGNIPLLKAIRAAGGTNVVLLSSAFWEGEIEVWPGMYYTAGNPDALKNIAAGMHAYGYNKGNASLTAVLNLPVPIIITEFTAGAPNFGGYSWLQSQHIGMTSWGPNAFFGAVSLTPTGW